MKTPELLFTCPRCQQRGFTMRGLRAHFCRMPERIVKPLPHIVAAWQPNAGRTRLTLDELASATAEPQQANLL